MRLLRFTACISAFALALACAPALAAPDTSCAVGAVPPAATILAQAGDLKSTEGDAIASAMALVGAGRMVEARAQLAPALARSSSLPPAREALGWSLLALATVSEGEISAARDPIEKTRALLARGAAGRDAAMAHLVLGWTESEIGSVPRTREAFDGAVQAARAAGDAETEATALTHRALLEGRIGSDAQAAARTARAAVAKLPDPALRARLGVALGLALLPERPAPRAAPSAALAAEILAAAYDDASRARAGRELSHALGLIGELQWLGGETQPAVATLSRAVAAARAVPDDPWRFRWSWRLGLAQRDAGESAKALASLQEAVDQIEEAKARRSLGRFSASTLARNYRQAYLDLAEAQLTRADSRAPDEAAAQLRSARGTLELAHASEIEDFFRDPCIASRSARIAEPEKLDATAVLIHPVVLAQRLELLVFHQSGVARFKAAVDSRSLAREVQRLRNAVERPGSTRYLESARHLHQWLMGPIEAHLAKLGVKTLVWVPDGALRGLPFAALHDGKAHLVERYAVAVTPVATLTDPRPLASTGVRASLSGLTEASQGFAALPGVAAELDGLSTLLGVPALRDGQFTVAALQDTLKRSPVNAMHVASHGQFAPEAGETFLLAHDGRLTMPQLRAALAAGKIREEPLELLVLSACQTAAGDERAALGLAGVAITAGARSALATLWAVSDQSTSTLASGFYQRLLDGKSTRAEALRASQLALLRDERYAHPFFWAPYILIGSWL